MKKLIIAVTMCLSAVLLSAEFAVSQTASKSKSRIGRKTEDTSLTRLKQIHLLRITDTTGIGIGTPDSVKRLNFKPDSPTPAYQNNPNPYNPNPALTNRHRPVDTAATSPAPTRAGGKESIPQQPVKKK